ncbi:MAG: cell wall hydrolase [Pseudomonadota bacterium]
MKILFPLLFLMTTAQKCATFGGGPEPPRPEVTAAPPPEPEPSPQAVLKSPTPIPKPFRPKDFTAETPFRHGSFSCELEDHVTDWNCLMCACFHEGRGESYEHRLMIGKVIITRAGMKGRYPDSICGVITQGGPRVFQFSYLNPNLGKRGITIDSRGRGARKGNVSMNALDMQQGYRKCFKSTQSILKLERKHYASHYHKVGLSKRWAKNCRVLKTIHPHVFYHSCKNYPRAYEHVDPIDGRGVQDAVSSIFDNQQKDPAIEKLVAQLNNENSSTKPSFFDQLNKMIRRFY